MSISQLQKFFANQIVTIKATIKSLSGVKKVSVGKSSTDKKDFTVVDPTGSIRVVLWGDYCEKEVVKDNTYILKRFRSDQTSLEVTLIRLKMVSAQLKSVTHSKKF